MTKAAVSSVGAKKSWIAVARIRISADHDPTVPCVSRPRTRIPYVVPGDSDRVKVADDILLAIVVHVPEPVRSWTS